MRSFSHLSDVERALSELGRQLALRDADHATVICCGASVLCALGLLSRRTLDVDALGMIDEAGRLLAIEKFSAEMVDAVSASGLALDLAPEWFNAAASAVLSRGLPAGALERSERHSFDFGPCLTVRFLDRVDLIALKMFAALDPHNGRRHMEDLVEIRPSRDELRHGVDWISGWPSNTAFQQAVRRLLEGFEVSDLYPA